MWLPFLGCLQFGMFAVGDCLLTGTFYKDEFSTPLCVAPNKHTLVPGCWIVGLTPLDAERPPDLNFCTCICVSVFYLIHSSPQDRILGTTHGWHERFDVFHMKLFSSVSLCTPLTSVKTLVGEDFILYALCWFWGEYLTSYIYRGRNKTFI